MRPISCARFILAFGMVSQAQAFSHLVIEVNPTLESGYKYVTPLGTGEHTAFWRYDVPALEGMHILSGITLTCSAMPWRKRARATIECWDKERQIRVQTSVDCTINQSKETAAYLFFGKVDEAEGTRNFYFYCE
ncbi:TPA: hypothetical protein ACXYK5_002747 [Legionella pneumophila]